MSDYPRSHPIVIFPDASSPPLHLPEFTTDFPPDPSIRRVNHSGHISLARGPNDLFNSAATLEHHTTPSSRIFFSIVHERVYFNNREQSKTNQNDENAMCDYLSEYLRICFQLYEDSPRPFLNILRTLCV